MADKVSASDRSRMMAAVRNRDTGPERAVRAALFAAGYRYRLQRRDLPGSPDIVLPRHRIAVFVHGCFWHGHDLGQKEGYVRLHWTSTNRWSGEKRQCKIRTTLATSPQPLGVGSAMVVRLPSHGPLAARLHLPSGAYTFACRKAYRLDSISSVNRRVIAPCPARSHYAGTWRRWRDRR